jgi:hypothetical protein
MVPLSSWLEEIVFTNLVLIPYRQPAPFTADWKINERAVLFMSVGLIEAFSN